MHHLKKATFLLLLIYTGYTSVGQSKQEREYQEESEEVKHEIWDDKDAAFKVTEVPEKYNNESAVILALKFSMGADHSRRQEHLATTLHQRIKIQDKAALEEYSEFNIQKLKNSSWSRGFKLVSYMGIRIIKPNGQQRDIDMKEAVNVKNESGDKKQKIAISDLQVGDIIDYYMRINKDEAAIPDPLDYSIGERYPILNFSLDVRIARKMGIYWRYLNAKDSELKRSKDEDGNNVFTINKKDIPKVTDERWLYEKRTLPTLRIFYIRDGNTDVVNGINEEDIKEYLTYQIISVGTLEYGANFQMMKREFPKIKNNFLKDENLKTLTPEQLTELIYYYIRYCTLYRDYTMSTIDVGQNRKYYTPRSHYIANSMRLLLQEYDIPCVLAAAVPRSEGTLNDAVSVNDLEYFIIANPEGSKPVYCYMGSMFCYPGELPSSLEGQEAYTVAVTGSKREKENSFKRITLPFSKKEDNISAETLDITFKADNLQQLNFVRNISAKGQYRYTYMDMLLYEDMLKQERNRVHTPTMLNEDLNAQGALHKRYPEYLEAFSKARKDMQETVVSNINTDYDIKPTDSTTYEIIEQGLQHRSPPFAMRQNFTLDGLVKKAGNNYIVDIGKLISGQIELTTEQRTRSYDINMSFARTVAYQVTVNIPEGYKLEGSENLNKSVINDAGSFVSSTKQEGNTLVLTVRKCYNHAYEPAASWPQMIAFLDAAADFNKQKVLLKRI
ncbi:protein of unknown function [Chitinophaga sp. CF118]|uniref:DUF3857 domain-containing protein n=1 Tax=Chitinophaga sp. CF118 TaxID=1884367 RepID=UPI0008E69899|nr:DUF3857 domain-containing protein [Chitinophaga sp. CF118]SFD64750.1 protein of unknown function [Chitinophaga sp. CF118]